MRLLIYWLGFKNHGFKRSKYLSLGFRLTLDLIEKLPRLKMTTL